MANSSAEKRKHKRHNVTEFLVAVFDNRLGRIINISEKGLAVQMLDDDLKSLPEKFETFFFSKDKGFLVEDLPLKLVRKEIILSPHLFTVAAQFATSDIIQLDKVKQYISGLS
ncbi:MAG: PilZ domain-containing protein [Desulfobulbaceae bacterium]|uniref:PilZ domain-containing protein n=1 Tax=Candidatus Desulfobia pelagia TaxID=2841692 RepID=A0A8J6NI43_9BACT|nr:PilZ domain-containing protein [Candidatus Desulfobia pelagia]